MSTLESVVLPLEQSQSLAEHGVVLDTALRWVTNPYNKEPFVIPVWFPPADGEVVLCPAPVLSELLDAIRVKADAIEVKINRRMELERHEYDEQVCWELVGQGQGSCEDDWQQAVGKGTTDLLAACALLMEVAK